MNSGNFILYTLSFDTKLRRHHYGRSQMVQTALDCTGLPGVIPAGNLAR
jgi:hypothetical protein